MDTAFTGFKKETMARAAVTDAPMSFKVTVEIAKKLRGMSTDKAEKYLERVIKLQEPVPFTRYMNGLGHKPGALSAGRYPVKACTNVLKLLRQAVANAENQGLGSPLKIIHIVAQQAHKPMHQGTRRGLRMKRAHLEMVVMVTEESVKPKKAEKKQKEVKDAPSEPKTAAKPKAEKAEKKTKDVKHDGD